MHIMLGKKGQDQIYNVTGKADQLAASFISEECTSQIKWYMVKSY